jgi:hypothetical protein
VGSAHFKKIPEKDPDFSTFQAELTDWEVNGALARGGNPADAGRITVCLLSSMPPCGGTSNPLRGQRFPAAGDRRLLRN